MKSIVEEGSSIVKAIEKAWTRADKPAEFSVRIYELPQKNIFGFTSKSAKIGIFFEDGKQLVEKKSSKGVRTPKPRPKPNKPASTPEKPKKQPAPRAKKPASEDPWNKDMVTFANDWLAGFFSHINKSDVRFDLEPQRYHLRISFKKPVFGQDDQNRILFRSIAHLLLQSARNNFNRPLKGFKVVLTTD